MGWAARNKPTEVKSYSVRRWTAFAWSPKRDDESRKSREQHLQRTASILERRLVELAPGASVKQVSVSHAPQLMFELVVHGTDENDAIRRAAYRVERSLQTRVPTGMGRRVRLMPPWGESEAEEL